MPLIIPPSQTLADTGFSIDNSCRFDDTSDPHLLRTPGGAGNRRTWTFSVWVKRSQLGLGGASSYFHIFTADQTYRDAIIFDNVDKINVYTGRVADGGSALITTAVYRDTSSWYHLVWAVDTTQGTAANRSKLYVNGSQVTDFSTETYMDENWDTYINNTQRHSISYDPLYSRFEFPGYMAEAHFVDGTQLTPTSFGEADEDSGQWKPIEVDVTYGTNGFYLDFADAADLGDDESGNGNDFTETNIAASDQTTDTPTNNFSTLNVTAKALNDTLSEGSLKKTGTSTQSRTVSTFGFDSGKWYFEIYVDTRGSDNPSLGISDAAVPNARNTIHVGDEAGSFGYYSTAAGAANVNHGGTGNNGGTYSVYTDGHIIGVALNIDDLQVTFYNNGSNAVTSGTTYETLTAGMTYNFSVGTNGSGVMIANFGQEGTFAGNKTAAGNSDGNGYGNFFHSVPSGFLAACSKNLTDCAITPSEHFNTVLWTGNGGTQSISSLAFQPDFTCIKSRSAASSHSQHDAVRGSTNRLNWDGSGAEQASQTNSVTSFNSDGFSIGTEGYVNANTETFVGWCWKAGGAPTADNSAGAGATPTAGSVKIDGSNLG